MNIQLWIIIICGLLLYNIYYETNLLKNVQKYKKYYKMAMVVLFGFGVLKILKGAPKLSYENMSTMNQFIRVLPIDKNSKDLLTPFLLPDSPNPNIPERSVQKLQTSGRKSSKRCVSETKKKYVASLQDWKCNKCHEQLTAWYEVDHKKRLEYGGTNEIDNLEALCRECHGRKTAMENL